jgi:hypothetical protein
MKSIKEFICQTAVVIGKAIIWLIINYSGGDKNERR